MNLISWFQKVSLDHGSKLISRRSYKKGSSRPVGVDLIRMDYIRKIFSVEFATLINSEYLFINIDEVSFSFKTKYDRSWLKRGWSNEVKNLSFKGSQTMILGVSSNGDWLASPLASRNNSNTFMKYLQSLIKWIILDLDVNPSQVVLMMDNWSIHKTKKIVSYLESSGWIVVYIPAYTPTFAPVELIFHILKTYIWKQCKDLSIDLLGEEGERNIKEVLSAISKDQIKDSFAHSFMEINGILSSILSGK